MFTKLEADVEKQIWPHKVARCMYNGTFRKLRIEIDAQMNLARPASLKL